MRTQSLAGVLLALLVMAGAAAAPAQVVTQAEKDKALQYLETTKKNVLEATKGLSEAQWNFKPAPDRWSVAQTVEHIAAAEDFIRGMLKEKVMIDGSGRGRWPRREEDRRRVTGNGSRPHEQIPGAGTAGANKPFRVAGRLHQTFCGEPGDNRRFSENRDGSSRSRGRQPDGKAGWVRVCAVHRGAQ